MGKAELEKERLNKTCTGEAQTKELTEKKPCALFFDVDGTLMDEHGVVPESAKKAIHTARQRGNLIFINSGRPHQLAKWILREVEADGLLCGCGTNLWRGDTELYRFVLPQELVQNICADCRKYRLDVFLEGPAGTMFDPENRLPDAKSSIAFIGAQDGLAPYAFGDPAFLVSKFCLLTDKHSELTPFMKKYADAIQFIDRGGGFYECVPNGHTKGTAIEKMAALCGIAQENTYGFGDSTNDLEMLKAVRHPVIMGVHDKALEPYAEFITKPLEEDGIAFAMQHYGLI